MHKVVECESSYASSCWDASANANASVECWPPRRQAFLPCCKTTGNVPMLRFQVRQEVVHCANVIAPFWEGPFTEVGEARSFTLAGSDAFNSPARWTHLPTGKTGA